MIILLILKAAQTCNTGSHIPKIYMIRYLLVTAGTELLAVELCPPVM